MAQDQDKKAGKPTHNTRLNNEIAHRYGNANATVRTARRKPGESSLTEDLAPEAEPEVDEQEREQEASAHEAAAAPTGEIKKSLFELPRKEPARPSLLPDAPAPAAPAPSDGPATTKHRR